MGEQPAALEAALDQLYGSDPSEFVSVRKHLASALKAAGDKDAAKELGNARRPSTAAWALNQAARQHPELVEALLARSRDLISEQTGSASGDRERLRDAIRAHREALDAATDAALAALGARARDSFRGEIVSMLRAASTDTGTGRDLRTGRLVRDNESAAGFPEPVGLSLVPSGPRPEAERKVANTKVARRDATREQAAEERARAAAAEHEARRRAERARLDEAERVAAEAEVDATRAAGVVDQLHTELATARRRLREAQARVRRARDEAARVAARLDGLSAGAPSRSDQSRD